MDWRFMGMGLLLAVACGLFWGLLWAIAEALLWWTTRAFGS